MRDFGLADLDAKHLLSVDTGSVAGILDVLTLGCAWGCYVDHHGAPPDGGELDAE